jgi:hydrophobic/amphiphilic exporter-1 (mainly G- bacteria), HAE1 family
VHLFAAFSLRNRALIALVTIVAAVFGVLATQSLKEELIPSVQFPQLAVVSTYTGASPQVVSDRVSRPIEQALRGINGLESTSSTSTTGSSTVNASFTYGTNLDAAEQKIGSVINRIRTTLPDGVDPQVIAGSLADLPVLSVAVTGDRSQAQLATAVRQSVLPELEKLPGVRAASLTGAPGSRITITADEDELGKHRLTDRVIDDTLKASGVLVPAGSVTENGRNRSIQVGTELGSVADIRQLPLSGVTAAQWNGTDIPTIDDVSSVRQTADPVTSVALVNGKQSLTISVTKLPSANTVDVSRVVRDRLPDLRGVLGAGGATTVVFDQAPYIQKSIDSLFTEGLLGLGFAVLVILLFLLSVRATIVTAISIPTSILITLIGMQAAQYSLNILTLGAITIAIGRVVDDSIVVTENIARHFREDPRTGDDGRMTPDERRRSIFGAVREVAGAITASTVTTVSVFVPIAFVQGTSGELFRPFALTVAIALAASLFVALTIVPVLSYWFLRPATSPRALARRDERPFLERGYRPILAGTLRFPALTILAALAVLVGTGFLVPLLQTNYLGSSGQNTLSVTERLPDGTSLAVQTTRGRSTDRVLRGIDGVRTVATSIGTSGSALRDSFFAGSGTRITYSITTDGKADQDALQRTVRSRLKSVPGGGDYTISASQGFGGSTDIDVDITAGSASALRSAADRVLAAVQKLPEVAQATSNLESAQSYLAVDIDAEKAAKAGYSEVALAQVVARASQPTSIGSITIGDQDLTVYLRQDSPPTTRTQLAALKVATPTGEKRLDSLAGIRVANEPAAITSTDAKRSATVTATPAGQNTGAASAAVAKAVADVDLPAGTAASLGGVTSDQNDAFQQLGLALLAAILIVYTVMVATFRSLRQPILLLVSVPFAATGAILLQLASGIPLGVASIIGLVMLVGIVVTNAIVLIDLVNQYRERGGSIRDAVIDGSARRLRPILMTALATILALVPMASGLTGSSGFLSQPLALVVIGGLVSSTVLTLVVLPTLYYLVEGRRERRDARRDRRRTKAAAVAAAPPEPERRPEPQPVP